TEFPQDLVGVLSEPRRPVDRRRRLVELDRVRDELALGPVGVDDRYDVAVGPDLRVSTDRHAVLRGCPRSLHPLEPLDPVGEWTRPDLVGDERRDLGRAIDDLLAG